MKRTSQTILLLSTALILCLSQRALAQAPASLNGATVDYFIRGGTGPYGTSGKYRLFLSDAGGTYTILRLDSVNYTYGTWSYSQTLLEQGTISMYDALAKNSFSSVLTYSNDSAGSFYYGSASFPGSQYGNFSMHSGTAPSSIDGKLLQLSVISGSSPFRATGNYKIINPYPNYYVVQEPSGTSSSLKSFSYSPTNRTTGTMFLYHGVDSASSAFANLTFTDATKGVFVMRDTGWTGYQEGTFVISNFYAPTIITQPASQNVPAGTKVVLNAMATGTGPLGFQWYKNETAISGATSSAYTISSAQLPHSGSYHVIATNVGGSATSSTATLSVFACNYTLSSNAAFFNFTGGNGAVRVSGTSGCTWRASTTNNWITVTSATNVSGTATVTYSVKTNSTRLPRTGALNIAGKVFNVAQGADFTPTNISGKTLIFNITGGSGAPTTGSFLISASTSSTNTMQLLPLSSGIVATNGSYILIRSNSVTSVLKFNSRVATLTFSSPTRGKFQIVNANSSKQTGSFSLENKMPSFDSDARGDFVWQNNSGALSTWFMRGIYFGGTAALKNGTAAPWGWTAAACADFNRDGHSDILFQTSSGSLSAWMMNSTNWTRDVVLRNGASAGTGWKPITSTDFNEDQKADILFQNSDGRLALWLMNGTNFVSSIPLRNNQAAGAGWAALAAADLNGDRHNDILFHHSTGLVSAWLMSRTNFITSVALNGGASAGAGLRIAGAGDLNLDGFNDILFQKTNGVLSCWFMNGLNVSSTRTLTNLPAALNLRPVSPK